MPRAASGITFTYQPASGCPCASRHCSCTSGACRCSMIALRADCRAPVSRRVQCVVIEHEAPGLERIPYPSEPGKRVYENVSKEGWAPWLQHQTMLINEYRLTPI